MESVNGIKDLRTDDVIGDDEVFVEVDDEKAKGLHLSVAQIGDVINAFINGRDISEITLNNKNIYFHLKSQKEFREDIDGLNQLTISNQRGNLIPLGSVAQLKRKEGTPLIKHYDFRPAKTLLANVDKTKITVLKANEQLRKIFENYKDKYPDVSLYFGGVSESTKESLTSMKDAFLLSLIAILALLVLLFKSYIRPLIIITTIPLGLLGLGVAFFLHQKPVSFLALIGFVGLGGIIVNSGIILISFIERLRQESESPLESILSLASRIRLKAVLMTSFTTIGGLVPTAYGIGGSDSMLIPMTLAISWGLSSGTLLTLIWVPCAYAITEDISGILKRLKVQSSS